LLSPPQYANNGIADECRELHGERRAGMTDEATAGTSSHPGPAAIELPADMVQALIDHARAEYPNEMCGVIVGDRPAADGGRALRWEPTRNRAASPLRYEIHPDDLLRLTIETEDAGHEFWAIVHSHTHSAPRPSLTDVGLAFYPDAIYLLVSLAGYEPSVAAWRIVDAQVHPVELLVGH
jgi:proteasome lid subunit RPN8/RPN11